MIPYMGRDFVSCKVGKAKGRLSPPYAGLLRRVGTLMPTNQRIDKTMSTYQRVRLYGATYFFTLTLADRRATTLIDHINHLRDSFRAVHQRRPFETVAICILPDHLHAIWKMPEGDSDFSTRWSLIKNGFSRGLTTAPFRSASKVAKREKGIWQRRFWEHTIRDERDLSRHVDYIHFNPVKHGYVSRVRDWPHSSFHRFVASGDLPEDWGGDMKNIPGSFGE